MNFVSARNGLRLSALFVVLAAGRMSLATHVASAWGFANTVGLDVTGTFIDSFEYDSGGSTNADMGPDYHLNTVTGPLDPDNPSTPLFVRTSSDATEFSAAGVTYTSEAVWHLINFTELPQTVVLTYEGALSSQCSVSDPINEYAANSEAVRIYNSLTGYTNVGSVSTDTSSSPTGYALDFYNSKYSFVLNPNQSVTLGFEATSTSYASSAVPEPLTLGALGLGLAPILRRRKKA